MRTILAAGLTVCVSVSTGWASPISETFTSAVFFGDSLSDTGNLGPFAPPPPYFNGQFSNGPVFADILDDGFADDATENFAFGGALTSGGSVPDLNTQIDILSGDLGVVGVTPPTLGLRPLASILMGANNLYGALEAFGAGLIADDAGAEAAANQVASDAAADIGTGLQRLIDDFPIRDFLVFTLPDLGQTPRIGAGSALSGDARDLTETFNAALISELGGLVGPEISVTIIDVFQIFEDAVSGVGLPGLTNTSEACLTDESVCDTPDTYLFWDEVHPTAVAHAELARIVERQVAPIPVPPALPLLAAGVMALGWVSRRPVI